MIRGFVGVSLVAMVTLGQLQFCANIKPPSGGPKDTIPPLIIETQPLNQSLNYEGDEIMVKFHEAIKVDNLNKKLIITPRFEEFDYKSTKFEVIVSLLEPLVDSTTYTFNFTDGVKDLNEGNIARDVSVAFSTGNYIDSVTLVGKVLNLFTNELVEESVVALYALEDTLDLFSGKPMYYARTNEKGVFRFENLRAEPYQLYSFIDTNNDLVADSRKEIYGFLANPVNQEPQQVGDSLIILLSALNVNDLKLISNRPYQQYYDIKFVKSIVDFDLTLLDSIRVMKEAAVADSLAANGPDSSYIQGEDSDSEEPATSRFWDGKDLKIYGNYLPGQNLIRIFPTFPVTDSLAFHLWAVDSVGFEIDTILFLQFRSSNRPPLPFVTNFEPQDEQALDLTFNGIYRFTKPITQVNYDSIHIEYDSSHIQHFLPEINLVWNPSRTQLNLTKSIDKALIDTLLKKQENAEALLLKLKEIEKVRLDSMKQAETDSLLFVMQSMGLSHSSTIDSIKAVQVAIDSGEIVLDSFTQIALKLQLDSLVKLDARQLKELRPKPPAPDTASVEEITVADTLQVDSTLVSADTVQSEGRRKRKKRGLKLNLPKKKPKQVQVQIEQEAEKPIPPGGFRISIARGSFISVDGDTSGTISRTYSIKDPSNFGLIKGQIETGKSQFTIQLLNQYYEVILEEANLKEYEFVNVAPGDYYIRIMVDDNDNGKWDPGNVLELLEPERVIFYPQLIPVKENWELENELVIF